MKIFYNRKTGHDYHNPSCTCGKCNKRGKIHAYSAYEVPQDLFEKINEFVDTAPNAAEWHEVFEKELSLLDNALLSVKAPTGDDAHDLLNKEIHNLGHSLIRECINEPF